MKRLVVGITGSTGAIFGVRLLEALGKTAVESHLVISDWGRRTIEHETRYTIAEVEGMASVVHRFGDQGATISSGSFKTTGMVVAPCSMKTLAGIAAGLADNLVQRAADVVLKEQRKLVLMVRETPLSPIHLENMLRLARVGVIILPPMPSFYNHPETIEELVDHVAVRALDQFDISVDFGRRWDGRLQKAGEAPAPPPTDNRVNHHVTERKEKTP
jgi:4-hydroxy-3-polyprenylbenzoate decarboxylase